MVQYFFHHFFWVAVFILRFLSVGAQIVIRKKWLEFIGATLVIIYLKKVFGILYNYIVKFRIALKG
mgnify:CR=1 FL=1